MAMFSRRALQRAINDSLSYATSQKRRDWVSTLNSPKSRKYIPTEWEVVLLQVMSRLGSLHHEADLGGETTPDVYFESPALTFAADITTISDRGRHEQNPIDLFEQELRKRWIKSGIKEGGLGFHASTSLQIVKGSKPPIIVPPSEQFESLIFNDNFETFIDSVRAQPAEKRQIDVWWNRNSVIQIIYLPGRNSVWCTGHTSYTVPTQKDRNPLYLALKDKGDQLKRSGFTGIKGVIICDGGAHVLRNHGDSYSFSARDVVFHALKRHTSIDFVAILSLRSRSDMSIRQNIDYQIYVREMSIWARDLNAIFSAAVSKLPGVRQTPDNARSELAHWQGREKQHTHLRGMTYSAGRNGLGQIRMSTQTLLEVLAGRLSVKRMNETYSLSKQEGIFEHQLRRGCVIESAKVEKNLEEDSDEIIFTFGLPDPSVSPFTLPDEETEHRE
jgi:hypothetical protein